MDFAVAIEGLHEEGKGSWVLAVDSDSVLIAHDDDKTLHWYPMADCTILKVATPEQPRPVVVLQQQTKLVRPDNGEYGGINRELRRHPEG